MSKTYRFASLLPWAYFERDSVIVCKDGSYLTTVQYRGPDLDSATEVELVNMSAKVNNALKRLGSGWAIYAESKRIKSNGYWQSQWPNKVAELCDKERIDKFSSGDDIFESLFFLTFQYIPPSHTVQKLEKILIEDDELTSETSVSAYFDYFESQVNKIVDMLRMVWPMVDRLNNDELLTYLHTTVSPKYHLVTEPEIPMCLDGVISDCHFVTGLRPYLLYGEEKHYIQSIGINAFPGKATPGMLDAINRLGIEYRYCTRFIYLDKLQAERSIKTYIKSWFASQKSAWTSFKERILEYDSPMIDDDATDKGHDAKNAMHLLKKDAAAFGYYTLCITVMDCNLRRLSEKVKAIDQVINHLGFTTIVESVNATAAYLGTIPGLAKANIRKPILNTFNLSRLMPTSAVWSGDVWNNHLNDYPLFQAMTDGNTPFRFSNHIGDVGHTMIIGPTGAGKSTLLSYMAMSFLRYREARVVFFDVKRSSRVTTLLMSGRFYGLSAGNNGLQLQPLRDIDNLAERSWAKEWIESILLQENAAITPAIKSEIWKALESLASWPASHRTMTGFIAVIQNNEIKQTLQPYADGGAYGSLFDGDNDNISKVNWLSFEMGELLDSPNAIRPTLHYLFHRIENRLDGKPTLVICDETWIMLLTKQFSDMIKNWLKTFRSKNASLVFATQSLDDVVSSDIFATINDNVLTRIYLPNAKAKEQNTADSYRQFGLNSRQLDILANATPKQDYYLNSQRGNRLFQLGLDPLTLSVVGSSSTMDQNLIDKIIANVEYFPAAFLDAKGHHNIADLLKKPVSLEKEIA